MAGQLRADRGAAKQVEEEKKADGIVQKLKMVKDSPQGRLLIDQELGQRQPGPAAPTGESGG